MCGPECLAKDWNAEDIDQRANVTQYASVLSEFFFGAPNDAALEKFSLRMRERLKISYDTHSSVLAQLDAHKKAIAHLANFRIEFDENVIDAYAGHDTFLHFRYTNLSDDNLFRFSLVWNEKQTKDNFGLRVETSSFVLPRMEATLGATIIFDRIGIKEIAGMQITITDQFGDSANFRVEPYSFRVGNHEHRITQNISTHNQISIEGRGVIDASGMGANKSAAQSTASNQPRWKELGFSYVPLKLPPAIHVPTPSTEPVSQQKSEPIETTKKTTSAFDKSDPLSVLNAAEQGDAAGQRNLGCMYQDGRGVAQNDEQAVHWYRKAAEQGNALGQRNLGWMYQNGRGVAQNDEQAFDWYRKAAENRDALSQVYLGNMYSWGTSHVLQNESQAVHWYQQAAEQGLEDGQYCLALMYQDGAGVTQDVDQAKYWFRRAAQQGHESAIIELKNLE
jgi:hypothetical protein